MCPKLKKGQTGSLELPRGTGTVAWPCRGSVTHHPGLPRHLVTSCVGVPGARVPRKEGGGERALYSEDDVKNQSLGGRTLQTNQTRLCPAQLPPDQHSTWMNHTQTAPVCLSFIAFWKRTSPSPPGRSGQASDNVLPTQGRRRRVARRPGGKLAVVHSKVALGKCRHLPSSQRFYPE